jgi:hypothetical protein
MALWKHPVIMLAIQRKLRSAPRALQLHLRMDNSDVNAVSYQEFTFSVPDSTLPNPDFCHHH